VCEHGVSPALKNPEVSERFLQSLSLPYVPLSRSFLRNIPIVHSIETYQNLAVFFVIRTIYFRNRILVTASQFYFLPREFLFLVNFIFILFLFIIFIFYLFYYFYFLFFIIFIFYFLLSFLIF